MKIFRMAICWVALFLSGFHPLENLPTTQPFAKIVATSPKQRAGGAAKHKVIFQNFPINQNFVVWSSRGEKLELAAFKKLDTIQLDEKGMVEAEGKAKGQEYGLNVEEIRRGERVNYRFTQTDGTLLSETSYIPKPICKKSRQKTFSVEAELLEESPPTYFFKCKGIKEGEIVKIRSACGQEIREESQAYKEACPLKVAVEMEGKRGKTYLIEFCREGGDKLALRFRRENLYLQN